MDVDMFLLLCFVHSFIYLFFIFNHQDVFNMFSNVKKWQNNSCLDQKTKYPVWETSAKDSRVCIIGNWMCFSSSKMFRLLSKRLLHFKLTVCIRERLEISQCFMLPNRLKLVFLCHKKEHTHTHNPAYFPLTQTHQHSITEWGHKLLCRFQHNIIQTKTNWNPVINPLMASHTLMQPPFVLVTADSTIVFSQTIHGVVFSSLHNCWLK